MSENSKIEWTGHQLGAIKGAAKRVGVEFDVYVANIMAGKRWCTHCKEFHSRAAFGSDATQTDGLARTCLSARRTRGRDTYVPVPRTNGRSFVAPRDGDKLQARGRVNHLVKIGKLPEPNSLPCTDCGHHSTDRRHEYDHYLGYAAEHHEHVQVVCTRCHSKRDSKQSAKTHCKRGHEFAPENTRVSANGTRHCKECSRIYDRERGPRGSEHWAKVNAKRRGKAIKRPQDSRNLELPIPLAMRFRRASAALVAIDEPTIVHP